MNDRHAAGDAAQTDLERAQHAPHAAPDPELVSPPRPEQVRRVRIGLGIALLLVTASALGLWLQGAEQGQGSSASDRARAAIAVRTVTAERESLPIVARYTGELDADAAEIAARVGGLLEAVRVRIGDRVHEGEVLARVDTAQLVRQVAEVQAQRRSALASAERVQAELSLAQSELARTEPLLEDKLVSAHEVDALRSRAAALTAEGAAAKAQAEQAKARHQLLQQQIRDARLTAPFDGAVAERYLDPGAVVQHGTPVLRLVREGPLRVRFRVPERDLGRVRKGLPFELTTQATSQQLFEGRIERIAAAISREDRAAAVEGVLDVDAPALRPGMYAEIAVQLGVIEDATTVPGQAVLERPGEGGALERGVFAIENETARWLPVRVVGRSGERVAVEGVAPNTRVVTVGQERVRDGSAVLAAGGES